MGRIVGPVGLNVGIRDGPDGVYVGGTEGVYTIAVRVGKAVGSR